MASRAGWTINGKHFAETRTARMGSLRVMYFVDGKPVARSVWVELMEEAKQAREKAEMERA